MASVLRDPRAESVLAKLQTQAAMQASHIRAYYRGKRFKSWLTGTRATNPQSRPDMDFVRDKLVALDQEKCDLCYLLCRAIKAKRVVEFGTSFGVSTIHLAAAVRDNVRDTGGEGKIIGTEIEPTKAAVANANIAEAGLTDLVEVRVGDARGTLKDVGGPVDFLLLDSWIPLVRRIVEIMCGAAEPHAKRRRRCSRRRTSKAQCVPAAH